jgi:hypothetical protein
MSASGKRFPTVAVLTSLGTVLVLVLILWGMVECSGQTVPNQPPPQQQPQVCWLPAQGPLLTPRNYVRRLIGAPPLLSPYVAVGEPWSAQVQPVAPYYPAPYRRAW